MLPKVIGDTLFQVLPSDTSFLLKIKDMDSLGLIFDNLRNFLVHGTDEILVFRKCGHPFLLKEINPSSFTFEHLLSHRNRTTPTIQKNWPSVDSTVYSSDETFWLK